MKYFPILLIALLFLSKPVIGQTEKASIMIAHKWKLIEYLNADGTMIANDLKPSYSNKGGSLFITIKFYGDSAFGAQTYVNDVSGYFHLKVKDSINLKLGVMTAVGEYPWGEIFLKTIPQIKKFDANERDLKLYYDNGSKYMHFVSY